MRDISLNHILHGFTQPLESWSKLHRLSVVIGIIGLTFIASRYLWTAAQTVSDASRQSVIAKLTAGVQAAKAKVADLPNLRQRAAALEANGQATDEALLDDVYLWQIFAAAVTRSGLAFEQFAPGSITTQVDWRERLLKLQINGSFASLASFAAHLAYLSFPVIPISVQLTAQKNGLLALEATLRVIGVPQSIKMPSTTDIRWANLSNPFQEWRATSSLTSDTTLTLTPWQLVGVLRKNGVHAALVQAADNFLLLHVGDVLDDAVVTRIKDKTLFLDSEQGSRILSLREKTL